MVPSELKRELRPAMTEEEEESQGLIIDPINQDVFIFKLEDCSLKALVSVSDDTLHVYTIYMHVCPLLYRILSCVLSIMSTCLCLTLFLISY